MKKSFELSTKEMVDAALYYLFDHGQITEEELESCVGKLQVVVDAYHNINSISIVLEGLD
jgi:hypothetical protein